MDLQPMATLGEAFQASVKFDLFLAPKNLGNLSQ